MHSSLRRRLPLRFHGMPAATVEWRKPPATEVWWLSGPPMASGNYWLEYSDSAGQTIFFGDERENDTKGCQLFLEVGDSGRRVRVTRVHPDEPIGPAALKEFLDHVGALGKWGGVISCKLVVKSGATEVASNPQDVRTPVEPWTGALTPERFAADSSIRYCLADASIGYPREEQEKKEMYFGQTLASIRNDRAPRLFFTLKGALQLERKWRGFACIGLVGNIYRIPPGKKGSNPYYNGADMMGAIGGASPEQFDREGVLQFLAREEAKRGWHMIWKKGHAGLIKDGVFYECKPSGRGFTVETYSENTESAVRRYEARELASGPRRFEAHGGPYFISRLPTPPSPDG